MSYFALSRPKQAVAHGLFDCLQTSLQSIKISALSAELVGIGTDVASANIAAGGLKGLVETELPGCFDVMFST
jgi:hypothetical protein